MVGPALHTRRTFLARALTAAGAAMVGLPALGGCSDDERRLRFLNWQDYIDPAVLERFENEFDVAVSYSTYASNDELADRLALAGVSRRRGRKAETVDLIVPSDNLARRLHDDEQLRPLDGTVVSALLLAPIDEDLRAFGRSDAGDTFAVPWATGTTGIGYDRTAFDTPPDWSIFRDPSLRGKVTLLDERREAFAAALYSLEDDPNTTDDLVIEQAARRLAEMHQVAAFDSAGYLDALAEGRLVAAHGFSTDVLQAQRRNPDLAFVVPPQGGSRWVDLLCVPAAAPNPALAELFIAFCLDPAVSAENLVANLADTGNAKARALVPAELRNDPAVTLSDDVRARTRFLEDLGDAEALYTSAWEQVRHS